MSAQMEPHDEFMVDPETGEKIDLARMDELIATIRSGVELVAEALKVANRSGGWRLKGYETWEAFLIGEFGGPPLALERAKRPEVVASLHDGGLSTRAIASATGVSDRTVRRDIDDQVRQNAAPESSLRPAVDEDGFGDESAFDPFSDESPPDFDQTGRPGAQQPRSTTGRDGKNYQRPEPPASRPEPTEAELAKKAAKRDADKIEAIVERWPVLERLTGEHRAAVVDRLSVEANVWLAEHEAR